MKKYILIVLLMLVTMLLSPFIIGYLGKWCLFVFKLINE